eukprot:4365191-Prymnesium_polylepis.1
MSIEQRRLYILNQGTLSAIMVCGVLAALVISGIIFMFQLAEEAARVRREALASKARRLRYVRNDKEVDVPDINAGEFHLFLSHVRRLQSNPTPYCSTSGAFCPLNLWFDPQWQ